MNVVSVLDMDTSHLALMPARERVFALEERIKSMPTRIDISDLPLRHWIANGVWVREMYIPEGIVLTGNIHKSDHIMFVLVGDISIYDETGLSRIQAPYTFVSKAGIKRAGYAHKDTIVTAAFRMSDPNETDIKKLEEEFTCVDYPEFDRYLEANNHAN